MFALGHAVELPPEVRNHCRSVVVSFGEDGTAARIERLIDETFECVASDDSGNPPATFANEKDFSFWLLERLGVPARQFAGKGNTVVAPYISALAPMFWVDQDLGWRDLYCAVSDHDFVRDQGEEVARFFLGVPARHRAVDKGDFADAKAALESVKERIAAKRATVAALRKELGVGGVRAVRDAHIALQGEREALVTNLHAHGSVLATISQSHSEVDERLNQTTQERDAAAFALHSSQRKLSELQRLGRELRSEVEILETNEVAADAFRALCENDSCQFFRRPEESYGRRVLYLRDQLKDFQSAFVTLEQQLETLRANLTEREAQVARILREKQEAVSKSSAGAIVATIDAVTAKLSDVGMRLNQLQVLTTQQSQLETLVERAVAAEERVKQLRPTGGGSPDQSRLFDARKELCRSFAEWLAVLNAQNLPETAAFDESLRPVIGNEVFDQNASPSGSTRTRIVLAFHAAMVEVSARINGSHPPFLILDTPKQQEMHSKDLGAFVARFRELSAAWTDPVQLIMSATEEDFMHAAGDADETWRPAYGPASEPRFLGTVANRPVSETST